MVGKTYIINFIVTDYDDRVEIEMGFLSIVVEKDAEAGPLSYPEDGDNSGITVWENEYIQSQDNFVEFGGGPLIVSKKLDPSIVDRILEQFNKMGKGAVGE